MILKWITNEHAITVATWGLVFVTFLLVIATVILWLDSWKKGKEQRLRWKREDEQHENDREEERARWRRDDERREQAQLPRLTFGMETGTWSSAAIRTITIWCSNLGIVPFEVESVALRLSSDRYEDLPVRYFAPHRIVKSSEMVQIAIPREVFDSLQLTVDIEIWLLVTTAIKKVCSEVKAYSLFLPDAGNVTKIREGFYEGRRVPCETCGAIAFLDPDGIKFEEDLTEMINRSKEELLHSCPNHTSELLRSIVNVDGRRKDFKNNA